MFPKGPLSGYLLHGSEASTAVVSGPVSSLPTSSDIWKSIGVRNSKMTSCVWHCEELDS